MQNHMRYEKGKSLQKKAEFGEEMKFLDLILVARIS